MPSPSYTQKPFIQLMEQGKEEEYGIPSPVCCGVLAFDLYSNRINIISQQPFPFRSFIKSKKTEGTKEKEPNAKNDTIDYSIGKQTFLDALCKEVPESGFKFLMMKEPEPEERHTKWKDYLMTEFIYPGTICRDYLKNSIFSQISPHRPLSSTLPRTPPRT